MGTYISMRVARARRRRAATLIDIYVPMLPYLVVFCGGMEDGNKTVLADPDGIP